MAKRKRKQKIKIGEVVMKAAVVGGVLGLGLLGGSVVPDVLASRLKFFGDFVKKRKKFGKWATRMGTGLVFIALPVFMIARRDRKAGTAAAAIGVLGVTGAASYPFVLPQLEKFYKGLRGKAPVLTGVAGGAGQGDIAGEAAARVAAEMSELANEGLGATTPAIGPMHYQQTPGGIGQLIPMNVAGGIGSVVPPQLVAGGVGQVVPPALAGGHATGRRRMPMSLYTTMTRG